MAATNNNSNGRPATRRGRTWLAVGAVAVLALIPVFTRPSPLKVRATTVERGPIRSLISTNGKVEPIQNFEAHSPIPTTVKRLLVKEGDHVRKGQLLLQLDDADLRSQAARAQAQIKTAQAEQSNVSTGGTREELLTLETQLIKAGTARDTTQRNLEALRRLQQEGAASAGEVKQAEDALRQAEADTTLLEQKKKDRYSQPEVAKVVAQGAEAEAAYQAAEDALAKSVVRAPFDGTVYALPVKQGAYVQTGDLLLQVGDLSQMLVRSFVDEPDIGRLASGQKIEVTWDALPGRMWNGAVGTIPSTVKRLVSRNIGEVTCTVDNRDLRLLPNVNVGVTIITAEHTSVLTLLREAVRMDDTKPYVYQVVDGELKRRDVVVALQNLTRVEIAAGLSENAVVALSSADPKPLSDGARVKVVP
ncbi:MAG TPA: efflux RND transporter periplasmic adaptor subunit [Candidatus Dormibacteraeota bacterium]|nr:efflux RND transporter periplasmic adaptor subunit [Candidatus Dormibacteraeota bacterium]